MAGMGLIERGGAAPREDMACLLPSMSCAQPSIHQFLTLQAGLAPSCSREPAGLAACRRPMHDVVCSRTGLSHTDTTDWLYLDQAAHDQLLPFQSTSADHCIKQHLT